MNIYQLMKSRRTIRKFQRRDIKHDLLVKFVDHARFAPAGMNAQTVKFMIVDNQEMADKVFPNTHWAGYLKGEHSPSFDERPAAYILFLTKYPHSYVKQDIGAIAQSIQLMAWEEGIGTCWMGAIDRKEIAEICSVPEEYEIDTLLSLGYPAEQPVAVDVKNDDIKYYEDETGRLNVPKRSLKDVLIER